MDFFPIFLNIKQKRCLVAGGGGVAERKTASLLKSGADVILVSPELSHNLTTWKDMGQLTHLPREFQPEDLTGAYLVIAATDDSEVNRQIAALAGAEDIPVNVVDQPELCSFIVPSVIDRSPVVAAISTSGSSPVLARLIRSRMESMIPAGYGRLADLCSRFRQRSQKAKAIRKRSNTSKPGRCQETSWWRCHSCRRASCRTGRRDGTGLARRSS